MEDATSTITDTNKKVMYTFRFGTSNKLINLTEQQLDRIPYLSTLITHKNDFSSIQNDNGECVLNSRIRYGWFKVILNSIITGKPSVLFTELSQDANVLGMLQLYDFLCIKPLDIPLLKDEHLIRSNPLEKSDDERHVRYYRVTNLFEVRGTAVQLIIALSKNEYNLNDSKTLQRIFSLIMVILSNPNIFGFRLCYHTLKVLEKYCFSFFSDKQLRQLCSAQHFVQSNKVDSSIFTDDDDEPLPYPLENAFAWKGVYVSIEENASADCRSNFNKKPIDYPSISRFRFGEDIDLSTGHDNLNRLNRDFQDATNSVEFYRRKLANALKRIREEFQRREQHCFWRSLHSSRTRSDRYDLLSVTTARSVLMINNPDDKEFHIYQIKHERKNEAQSARSGRFNTLPKRPNVDKFKHRSGAKAQKYR